MALRSLFFRFTALSLALFGAIAVSGPEAKAVGTRRFVLDSAKDFEAGDLGTSSVDSRGQLRAGFGRKLTPITEAPVVWAALETQDGLLLGTGNDGKLLSVKDGVVKTVVDTDWMAVTSIVSAFGRTLVAGFPSETIFELRNGKLEPFAKLDGTENVFALAFDAKTKSLFVATGPEGKLYRVNEAGRAEVYFDSDEGHLVSLLAHDGTVYAGSSGKARLYEITGPGRARVLYDFEGTEVRGIVRSREGALFVISNDLGSNARGDGPNGLRPAASSSATPPKGKGALHRLGKEGHPEEMFLKSDEHFTWLGLDPVGNPVVGTGVEGRLYAVGPTYDTSLLLDLDARQIAFARLTERAPFVLASDSATLVELEEQKTATSEWTSKPLDAGLVARFGLTTVDADGRVEVLSRSGNTDEPDAGWSDWQPLAGGRVVGPPARYLQLRVRLAQGALLRSLEVPFVTDNLRAVVTSVDVESNVKKRDSRGVTKSGGPRTEKPSSTIKVSWKVKNPDSDELRYALDYQLLGTKAWFDALDPGQVLTDEKFNWNTENLPEGRYRLRVTATDDLANPSDRATRHTLESPTVLVDNTPPQIEGLRIQGRRVSFSVRDRIGPVDRVEVRLEGREPWIPLGPKDGIFDEALEEIDADLTPLAASGPAMLIVRAYDSAGNFSVAHVALGP